MRMRITFRFFLLIFALTTLSRLSYGQLPNQNTYLISNIDHYGTYSALWGYTAPDQRQYAILGCDTGTSFVDITDSSNVYEVDFVSGVFSTYREMKTYSHYAYIVSEGTNSRLQIIDLQYLPDSVSLVSTYSFAGYTYTHAISQSGPYLYLSGGNASPSGGVRILDVNNPLLPQIKGAYSTLYAHDCRVSSDTLWVTNILNRKISIVNATDKDNPVVLRDYVTLWSQPHNCAISPDRKHLYVTHENNDPGKLTVYNIEDITNITYVRDWQPTGIVTSPIHNVEVFGNYLIAAHYTAGIRILDIKNSADPVEIAWYDTRPEDNSNIFEGCWAVYVFPDGKIIGSDISNGLFVIKSSVLVSANAVNNFVPAGYKLEQNYPNPFNPATMINYEIPLRSFVDLKVYDASGKIVRSLVGTHQEAGTYSVSFNAGELPSGIYFYRLNTSGGSFSKKMLLVK